MAAKPVLVVGAGPTGLMLALWLARLGAPVRIIDKDDGPGETSRAMAVQARTLEFYRQLGFADEVVSRGLRIDRVSVREVGRLEGAATFGDFGRGISPFPFVLSFPQDEHETVLLAQLERAGVAVERRTALTGFDQDPDGVRTVLDTPSGSERFAASYVAGCDGARSTVRAVAGIGLPGGTYAQRFFVADADVEGEASCDSMNLCVTGEDFCIVIPLRRPGEARLIGLVPDGVAADEVRFDDVEPAVARNTGLTVTRVHWFSTYRVHHRVSDRFRDRRAFLLGDAAHLHSPVGGQGMNTGLGDAANLAWKLAAVLAKRADPAILDTYEAERIAFARRLVNTTDRMFRLVTDPGPLGRGWRRLVMAHALPFALNLPLAASTMFRLISQTRIAYPDSPLSQGRAGGVRAGDRLPWIGAEGGGPDNHEALGTLDWQVHVYGEAAEAVRSGAAAHGLPLHAFAWSEEAGRKGLCRDALYLVRPDGYVGLANSEGDFSTVAGYVERWGLAPLRGAGV